MACVAFVGGPFAGALASSQAVALAAAFAGSATAVAAWAATRPEIGGPCLAERTKGLELVGAGGIAGGGLHGSLRSTTCMLQSIGPSFHISCLGMLRGGGGLLTGGTFCVGTLTVPKLGTGGGPFGLPAPGGGLGSWNRDMPVAEPAGGSG